MQTEQELRDEFYDMFASFSVRVRREFNDNIEKGHWNTMPPNTAMLEIHYHVAKLHYALKHNDYEGIMEYAADTASMCAMLADIMTKKAFPDV